MRVAWSELVDELDRLQGYAFPNRWAGEPLTPGHGSRPLLRAFAEPWTGHPLRHRFGTVALEGTKDPLAVGRAMGRSRPETTPRYCVVFSDRLAAVAAAAAMLIAADGWALPGLFRLVVWVRDGL